MASQINPTNYEATELLQGPAQVLSHLFAFVDTLAVKSAIELRIPDIIQSHTQPMTLLEIASKIKPSPADITCLVRVMRVLGRKNFLSVSYQNGEPLYGPTPASKLVQHDYELSLVTLFLSHTYPSFMSPWHEIGRSIKEGGTPFEKAHGGSLWEKMLKETDLNELFNTAMAAFTSAITKAIISGYGNELSKLEGTLVDVAGGIGKAVSEIFKAYPNIYGINFDLPHVVGTAPQCDGVTHIGGDLFVEVPKGDTLFIKNILHDWGDEDGIKILRNCQKAVSNDKGKVIIVDIVLQPEGNELMDDAKFACDLLMMVLCVGGKERTENDWKKLLNEAGFARYNIIFIPSIVSIIEAFLK